MYGLSHNVDGMPISVIIPHEMVIEDIDNMGSRKTLPCHTVGNMPKPFNYWHEPIVYIKPFNIIRVMRDYQFIKCNMNSQWKHLHY